ncbi:hypothetical protein PS914_03209 [Pseudomonas fluorescens]|uniref:tape measure protein n=1 Tax=Pseudomonas fluorescens TaxID=294 RepID=UPI001240A18D|nr:tape measure protein [Pseudomonas fluorescens]VVP91906.1 hypothetical protein PS914_03209 [Pseudomonas fluorescens]
MSNESIGKFFGELGFKVDFSGINAFERRMKQLSHKINAVGKQMEKALNIKPNLANFTAQMKALQNMNGKMTKAQMAAAKFTLLANQKAAALGLTQAKVAAQNAKTQQNSAMHTLRMGQQQLRNQTANTQQLTQQQRLQQATHRTQLSSMRVNQAMNAAQTKRAMAGGLGGLAGSRALGFQMPALGGFAGALSAATGGAMALTAAMAAAAFAMKSYVDAVVKAGQTQTGRISQFAAGYDVAGADPVKVQKQGREANYRFMGVADELGLDASAIGADYTKNRTNLMDAGMSDSKAEKTLHGFLSFGKGTGMTSDAMKGVMNAMGQSLSKGQLMSEEWKSQIAEHLPGAGKLGGEAYQMVTGGKLTGEKATAALSDAMAKGLIKGDTVKKFYETVAQLMERDANRGGRLDIAKNNAESMTNRRANVSEQVLANAYTSNDGAMGKALIENSKAQIDLISKLGPIADKMAGLGTKGIEASTTLLRGIEQLIPAIESWMNGVDGAGVKLESAMKSVTDGIKVFTDGFESTFKTIGIDKWIEKVGGLWDAMVRLNTALEPLKALIGLIAGVAATLASMGLQVALTTLTGAINLLADGINYIAGKLGYVSQAEKANNAYNEAHPNRLVDGSALKPSVMAPVPNNNVVLSQMANSPIVGGLLKLHQDKIGERMNALSTGPMTSAVTSGAVAGGGTGVAAPSTTTITNDIKLGDINLTVTSTATNTADLMKDLGPQIQQAAKDAARQGVNEAQSKSGTAGILIKDVR